MSDPHYCWSVACSNVDACGIRTGDFSRQDEAIDAWNRSSGSGENIRAFYDRVCARAETNMELTGTVSGAHWNAMRQELAAMGIEVAR